MVVKQLVEAPGASFAAFIATTAWADAWLDVGSGAMCAVTVQPGATPVVHVGDGETGPLARRMPMWCLTTSKNVWFSLIGFRKVY